MGFPVNRSGVVSMFSAFSKALCEMKEIQTKTSQQGLFTPPDNSPRL